MSLPLILASRSEARATLLRKARIAFELMPTAVDEGAVKAAMIAEEESARDIADALAELKARRIAGKAPGRLVLGADQVLVCDGRTFDKPRDLAEAGAQLRELRGRTHELLAAAVVFEEGRPVWRQIGSARLSMRPFSEAFLERYIEEHGAALFSTVGAYRLEDGGAQLFNRIQGDYFSVLGLPLLELLEFLRTRGVCPT
jgi:nucleoside triphosphate pyrophosphatase